MHRTLLLTALSLGVIGIAALGLEQVLERQGAWAGSVCGAALGLIAAFWLRHTLIHRPQHSMRASVEGFLALLAGLLLSALCVRFVPDVQKYVDWRLFIVAYAAGALVPLLAGTVESASVLRKRSIA